MKRDTRKIIFQKHRDKGKTLKWIADRNHMSPEGVRKILLRDNCPQVMHKGRTYTFLTFDRKKKADVTVPYALRPKGRSATLHKYIQNNDILYDDDIYKMSFNDVAKTLARYTKRHGITITRTENNTWEIQPIKK